MRTCCTLLTAGRPDAMTIVALYLLLGACLSCALAIYGWPRRAAPGASLFAPSDRCITLGSGAAALEMIASSPATRQIWSRVSWIGVVALPLCWLLFCIDFTGSWRFDPLGRAVALLASPAMALVRSARRLSARADRAAPPSPRSSRSRSSSALAHLYGWLLFALGMALLARRYARSRRSTARSADR